MTPARCGCAVTLIVAAATLGLPRLGASADPPGARRAVLVGVEYDLGLAGPFVGTGAPLVKPIPDAFKWGSMQASPTAAIDFRVLDRFVLEYQSAGFEELLLGLKSHSSWASRDGLADPAPKPEYLGLYEAWVGAVVERYDGDGTADVPGLLRPVRLYEIGVEYSSYEPEAPAEYLEMLQAAATAARRAFPDVLVAHAAFLTTTAFRDDPGPADYEATFAAVDPRIAAHSLADLRAVLDRPDLFDLVNFHALGDVAELERTVRWLRWEMAQRGYDKAVIVSDTATTPFVAWGPATRCTGPPQQLGIVIPPAVETDRCRLAAYFTRLVAGDAATVAWTQGHAARDVVQRVVTAAGAGVLAVDAWSMEDIPLLKAPLMQASGGTGAWAGMVEASVNLFTGAHTATGFRPAYFALRHLAGRLAGARSVQAVARPEAGVRLYRLDGDGATAWVAWLDPGRLVLPGDAVPAAWTTLEVAGPEVTVERTPTEPGRSVPERTFLAATGGVVTLEVTPDPVIVVDGNAPEARPRVRRRLGTGP